MQGALTSDLQTSYILSNAAFFGGNVRLNPFLPLSIYYIKEYCHGILGVSNSLSLLTFLDN